MPLPLLTTDYFSQPEPTGSVSGTVARIMAANGTALADRVEKQQLMFEARMLAPAVTSSFGEAYRKIAGGDMSGFDDLSKAGSIGAGNPLLAALSSDARRIGTDLAQNYTTSALQAKRLEFEQGQAKARFGHEEDMAGKRFTQERVLQTDRFNKEGELQDDKQFETELARVDTENQARKERNEKRLAAAKEESQLAGKEIKPEPLESMLARPTGPSRPARQYQVPADGSVPTSPLGMLDMSDQPVVETASSVPPVSNHNGANINLPMPAGPAAAAPTAPPVTPGGGAVAPIATPAAQPTTSSAAPAAAPTSTPTDSPITAAMADPAVKAIQTKYGATSIKFNITKSGEGKQETQLSLTREDGTEVKLSPEESAVVTQKLMASMPETEGATPAPTVAARLAQAKPGGEAGGRKIDLIDFGGIQFQIGQPGAETQMKLKQQTVKLVSGGTRTYEAPPGAETGIKDRTDFIEALGVMKTDPNAATFVSQFLAPNGKGVVFQAPEYAKDGKTVLRAQMFGIAKDGTAVPFNPAVRAEGAGETPGTVEGNFVRAYETALSKKDLVNSKYGVTPVSTGNLEKPVTGIKASPEIQTKANELNEKVKKGDMTVDQARIELKRFNQERNASRPGSTDDKYTLPTEEEEKAEKKKAPEYKAKVDGIKKEIARLEKIIDSGKDGEAQFTTNWGGGTTVSGGEPLTVAQRKKYIIMRRNLQDQLKGLE